MADVKELILTIVRPLVSQPEAVSLEMRNQLISSSIIDCGQRRYWTYHW